MRVRQLSILMLAGLTLVAACGSSDDSGSGKTESVTTASLPPVSAVGSTTSTKPKIPFAAGLAQIQAALVAAKGDACKLYDFPNQLETIQNPSNVDESKAAANMLTTYFTDIADVMQSKHPSEAATLRADATKYADQAAKANYDLNNPSVNAVTNEKPFQQAFATFQQENSGCATTTTMVAK